MSKHKPFHFTMSAEATLASVAPGTAYKVTPIPGDECGDLLVTVWPCKAPHAAAITFEWGGPNEEGWHRESVTVVQRASDPEWDFVHDSEWRDCDGRGSRCYMGRGDGTRARGRRWSATREVSRSQRDYTAEMAGY